jgi:copper ion binding protein
MKPIVSRIAFGVVVFVAAGLGVSQSACAQCCSRTSGLASVEASQKANLTNASREPLTFYLQVGGMTCQSCVSTVQATLVRTAGVSKATVDLTRQRAIVVVEPGRLSSEDLVKAIDGVGFTGTLLPVETICLRVSGMTCEGCATSVHKALAAVEGVEWASVDFQHAIACVARVKNQASLETLQRAVAAAGGERHAFGAEPVSAVPKP